MGDAVHAKELELRPKSDNGVWFATAKFVPASLNGFLGSGPQFGKNIQDELSAA